MSMPRRTKGERLQLIHHGPEGQGKLGMQRNRGKTDTDKPIKEVERGYPVGEGGFRKEKERSYVANAGSTSPIQH